MAINYTFTCEWCGKREAVSPYAEHKGFKGARLIRRHSHSWHFMWFGEMISRHETTDTVCEACAQVILRNTRFAFDEAYKEIKNDPEAVRPGKKHWTL